MTIKLPVISIQKSRAYSIYRIAFVTIAMTFLVLFVTIEDDNNLIGKSFLAFIMGFVIIQFLFKKISSTNGFIEINKNEITHYVGSNITQYKTRELKEICLIYEGYEGEVRSFSGLLRDSGNRNVLKFNFNGLMIHYNIKLKYEYFGLLRQVLKEFETTGEPILVLNSNGKRIKI
jgi:hypothetical protein